MKTCVVRVSFFGALYGKGLIVNQMNRTFNSYRIRDALVSSNEIMRKQFTRGEIIVSDFFPYQDSTYYVCKPMCPLSEAQITDIGTRKKIKTMGLVPIEMCRDFCHGSMDIKQISFTEGMIGCASFESKTERFEFAHKSGLYLIVKYDNQKSLDNIIDSFACLKEVFGTDLFSLSVERFEFNVGDLLKRNNGEHILLSSESIEMLMAPGILDGASYKIYKDNKMGVYLVSSGSVFKNKATLNGTKSKQIGVIYLSV